MGDVSNIFPGGQLDHIAYAVRSTDAAIRFFSIFYPEIRTYKKLEPEQKVFITYLGAPWTDHKIELVEPAEKGNPVENLIETRESQLYHICFAVTDFSRDKERLQKQGFFLVTEPFASQVTPGFWAAHFFHPHVGLIEITGRKREGQ
ncbi:MAG: hypothetical protein D6679_08820 [Candidatus Hydrogenedentota bacterium]|nr:MAG: hypothetical protein D6679_08820 [Candidatus Hydrogenedentota bacterium]